MSYDNFSVVDCDGHIVELIAEMAEFMSTRIRQHAMRPSRNRQGVFPSLDGFHYPVGERGWLGSSVGAVVVRVRGDIGGREALVILEGGRITTCTTENPAMCKASLG